MSDLLEPDILDDSLDVEDIVQIPLWRIRLKVAWRSFRKNWALFSDNKAGVVGLMIIVIFGIMAISHPILLATAWEGHEEGGKNVYDVRAGSDSIIVEKTVVAEVTDPETQISQIDVRHDEAGGIGRRDGRFADAFRDHRPARQPGAAGVVRRRAPTHPGDGSLRCRHL